MALMERTLHGDFDELPKKIVNGVVNASVSASLEESSDFKDGNTRCSVRIFERYSMFGGNRVSMSVVLFQGESGEIRLSASTSGGSQAVFWKMNTVGEENFLDTLRSIL